MNVGAAVASGAGLLAALVMIGIAWLKSRGDGAETEDLDLSPRQFLLVTVSVFGGVGAVVALAIGVGTVFFDLSAATVGLGDPSLRSAGVGVLAGVLIAGVHKGLVRLLKAVGLTFTELYGEMVPETVPGLGWYAAGIGVQASAEEVVFRAALVGVPAALFGVSPWLFVVPAAILFGVAHTGRGSGSVVSTALVGILWGGLFVTWGLVAAAVAHAVNNTVAVAYYGLIDTGDGDDTPVRSADGVGE